MGRKVIVDIQSAIEYKDKDGSSILVANIKIDDVEFQIKTDKKITTPQELAELAIKEYKDTYREELMTEVEMVI